MPFDNHDLFALELLNHVEKDRQLTNRLVARKLGVSVRLAHDLLKRMVDKGLLHVKVVHSRRWDYFLTPKGIMEKARLTLEFFEFSMHFYREARKRSAQVCRNLAEIGATDIGFMGSGDLAEISYLGVQEWQLNLQQVFDNTDGNETFFMIPIKPLSELQSTRLQAIIVCLYNTMRPMDSKYLPPNVHDNGKFHWIF